VDIVLAVHGGNPLDELLVAAAGALFLVGGYIAIKMAPSPAPTDERPDEDIQPAEQEPEETPARPVSS
jgi:hypothetical protein